MLWNFTLDAEWVIRKNTELHLCCVKCTSFFSKQVLTSHLGYQWPGRAKILFDRLLLLLKLGFQCVCFDIFSRDASIKNIDMPSILYFRHFVMWSKLLLCIFSLILFYCNKGCKRKGEKSITYLNLQAAILLVWHSSDISQPQWPAQLHSDDPSISGNSGSHDTP